MAEKRNIYRKAALDRLSSPDQLDKPITIIPSGIWFAIAGGVVALGITLAWAILGRIPVTVQTSGIYTYGDGVNSIYATNGGIVSNVYVLDGDQVQEGDLIAQLENDDVQTRIDNINARLAKVEAVTLDSVDDEGNADNKEMLDLKSQLLTVDNNKNLDDQILADKENELADQSAKTDAAEAEMEAARETYYAGVNEGSATPEQLAMSDAKDDVTEARNKLQAAKSDYQYAKNDIATAKNDVSLAKSDVSSAKSDLDRIKNYNQSAKNDVSTAKSDYATALNDVAGDNSDISSAYSELTQAENEYETAKNYLANAQTEYANAVSQYVSLSGISDDALKNDERIFAPNSFDISKDQETGEKVYKILVDSKEVVKLGESYKGSNFQREYDTIQGKIKTDAAEIVKVVERMNKYAADKGVGGAETYNYYMINDDGQFQFLENQSVNKPNHDEADKFTPWGMDEVTLNNLCLETIDLFTQYIEYENQRKQYVSDVVNAYNKWNEANDAITSDKLIEDINAAQAKVNALTTATKTKKDQDLDRLAKEEDDLQEAKETYDNYNYTQQIKEAEQKVENAENNVSKADTVAEATRKAQEVYSQISASNDAINSALDAYYQAENDYIDAQERQLAAHISSTINSDGYNNALENYRSELQLQRSIDDSLVQLRAKAITDGIEAETQREMIGIQFDNAKASAIAKIGKELKEQEANMRNTQIRATRSGVITDLHILEGSAVQGGALVANVKSTVEATGYFASDVVVCFAPISEGRKIDPGMDVKVYASTADRNEYGHMIGKVIKVDPYVTSKEAMTNELGDSTLVDTFTKNGPVVEVTVELEKDPTSASGYAWSSEKGKEIKIEAGTIITSDTVIESKAPISMLVPYLKDRFDNISTVEQKDNSTANGEQSTNNG